MEQGEGRQAAPYWRAGYVILDMAGALPRIEFIRVDYDLERTMKAIRKSDLPDEFAEYLATGGIPKPVESAADAG